MKKCPMRNCGVSIADRMFVCGLHWKRIPSPVKDEVIDVFNRYIADEVSLTELRSKTTQILADLQGLRPEEVGQQPKTLAIRCCRRCGRRTVLAECPDGSGRVELDELTAAAKAAAGDDSYVIIGCVAWPAAGKGRQYARFGPHRCVAAAATQPNSEVKAA